MNIFDTIQDTAFGTVTNVFGYAASWLASNAPEDSEPLTAKVLYKDATEKTSIGDFDYSMERYFIEYKIGDFAGLQELVNSSATEKITVELKGGPREFYIKRVETKYDGKTIVAILHQPNV